MRTSWPRMSDPTYLVMQELLKGGVLRSKCSPDQRDRIERLVWDGWAKIAPKGLHGDLSLTEEGKTWLMHASTTRQARAVQAAASARTKATYQHVRPKTPSAPSGDDN